MPKYIVLFHDFHMMIFFKKGLFENYLHHTIECIICHLPSISLK